MQLRWQQQPFTITVMWWLQGLAPSSQLADMLLFFFFELAAKYCQLLWNSPGWQNITPHHCQDMPPRWLAPLTVGDSAQALLQAQEQNNTDPLILPSQHRPTRHKRGATGRVKMTLEVIKQWWCRNDHISGKVSPKLRSNFVVYPFSYLVKNQ